MRLRFVLPLWHGGYWQSKHRHSDKAFRLSSAYANLSFSFLHLAHVTDSCLAGESRLGIFLLGLAVAIASRCSFCNGTSPSDAF